MTSEQYDFLNLLHLEATGETLSEIHPHSAAWDTDNLLGSIRLLNRYLWEYTSGSSLLEWYGPQWLITELEKELYLQLMMKLAGDVLHRESSLRKNRNGI